MWEKLTIPVMVISIPIILQCNKQDIESALKPEVIQNRLSADGLPNFPAVAIEGKGIFETLRDIIVRVGKRLEI